MVNEGENWQDVIIPSTTGSPPIEDRPSFKSEAPIPSTAPAQKIVHELS